MGYQIYSTVLLLILFNWNSYKEDINVNGTTHVLGTFLSILLNQDLYDQRVHL